jgi:hypothetical protein
METLFDASKEVGLEVNTENNKHLLLFRHQNAWQICDINIDNRRFEMWQSSDIWGQLQQIKT